MKKILFTVLALLLVNIPCIAENIYIMFDDYFSYNVSDSVSINAIDKKNIHYTLNLYPINKQLNNQIWYQAKITQNKYDKSINVWRLEAYNQQNDYQYITPLENEVKNQIKQNSTQLYDKITSKFVKCKKHSTNLYCESY